MGTTLTGTTPQDTYDSLIKVTDNGPLDPTTAKYLSDGLGNDSPLALSQARVGIGTNAPSNDLTLSKSVAAGNVVLQIENTSTTGSARLWFGNNANSSGARIQYFGATHAARPNLFSIGTDAANDVMFETNGSERMRITSAGNVGVGTSSPTMPLDIVGTPDIGYTSTRPLINLQSNQASATAPYSGINFSALYNSGGGVTSLAFIGGGKETTGNGVYGGFLKFSTRTDGSSDVAERMRITSTGNVGIGTSSPSTALSVNGAIQTTLGSGGVSLSGNGSPDLGYIGYNYYNVSGTEAATLSARNSWRIKLGNGADKGVTFDYRAPNAAAGTFTEYVRIQETGGISFNGDTAAANALDDYEEGIFSPTAFGVTTAGTTTYTGQNGYYTKIGRQVTISLYLSYTSMTGTGTLKIGGLPFAIGNLTENYPVGSCIASSVNWTGGTYLQANGIINESNMYIVYVSDDASANVQDCVDESANFRITMTYFV